jgi:hypothetical protein
MTPVGAFNLIGNFCYSGALSASSSIGSLGLVIVPFLKSSLALGVGIVVFDKVNKVLGCHRISLLVSGIFSLLAACAIRVALNPFTPIKATLLLFGVHGTVILPILGGAFLSVFLTEIYKISFGR